MKASKPNVRLVGRGAIIPQQSAEGGGVIFPFEAVGLRAVDVEVFKIFNSNILQYLQVNEIEGDNELERVGKIIMQKKVSLSDLNPDANNQVWQRYALDLKDIIQQDPGAIYQVRLAFRRGYAIYACAPAVKKPTANGRRVRGRTVTLPASGIRRRRHRPTWPHRRQRQPHQHLGRLSRHLLQR
ncbi:MAG: hypothetical protein IPM98_05320 [Lewinellaceae bacterium]|nr:hypothetical protein [Lewinellaceae bacterium]